MAGRLIIQKRRRIFAGVEGESERSFVAWMQRLCDTKNRLFHLDIFIAGGGDCAEIASRSADECRRRSVARAPYCARIVLLDSDRLKVDVRNGRDPTPIAKKEDIDLVFFDPNLEGLLLRLCPTQETRRPTSKTAISDLKKYWPDYKKPPSADDLSDRFDDGDLRRVARHDEGIRKLLKSLDLIS